MKCSSISVALRGAGSIRLTTLASVLNRKCGSIWACSSRICASTSCFSVESVRTCSRAMYSAILRSSQRRPSRPTRLQTSTPWAVSPSPQPSSGAPDQGRCEAPNTFQSTRMVLTTT
ncbi:hypothetical protein D3C72_1989740 [compost metagenome]